jgi:hypothetical protein
MIYFAEISGSNNIVTRVIVAEQDFIDSGAVGTGSNWVQTSYDTHGGVHYGDVSGSYAPDGGTQLRKNYAGIGYTYNSGSDAFIAPQPQNFVSSSLTFYKMDDDPPPSYIRNYFTQNPSGSIPYILNEDSCLWELSGSGV